MCQFTAGEQYFINIIVFLVYFEYLVILTYVSPIGEKIKSLLEFLELSFRKTNICRTHIIIINNLSLFENTFLYGNYQALFIKD